MFNITLTHRAPCHLAGLAHTGPYPEISRTFAQVFALFDARNEMPKVRGMIAVYHDNPATTPAAKLNSFAAAVVSGRYTPAPPLQSLIPPGGDHAVLLFKGPYVFHP